MVVIYNDFKLAFVCVIFKKYHKVFLIKGNFAPFFDAN